jgi:hypothetical protein
MGLARRFKVMIGSDSAGMPSEGKGPAWENQYETLRKRWGTVPTATSVFESTTKLTALSDEALLVEWERARTDITTGPEVGGHWLQLAYPRSRWVRDGRPRFIYQEFHNNDFNWFDLLYRGQ